MLAGGLSFEIIDKMAMEERRKAEIDELIKRQRLRQISAQKLALKKEKKNGSKKRNCRKITASNIYEYYYPNE
jgi:hypothetical protein